MLVVTTSVRVVNGVHGNTSSLGPVVPLALGPEERSSGLQQGLVDTSTSSDDSDGSTGQRRDGLLGTGRQPDSGLLVLDRVSDDGSVVTRSSGERTSVPGLLLDVADDGTLGALSDGEDVADVQGGLLSAVDERTGRETLGGDESLLSDLVSVRVSEDNGGQGGTSTSVVDDVLDNSPDVSVLLGKVQGPELGRVLPVVGVGLEDPAGFTLVPDNSLFMWNRLCIGGSRAYFER